MTIKPFIITFTILVALSGYAWAKPLQPGVVAPGFSAPSDKLSLVSLSAFKGKPVILVFYPADFTPGCTVQLCGLRDNYAKVKAAGADVLAVNPSDVASHKGFAQKHHLPFNVIADAKGQIAKAYGVGQNWGFNTRTVFIIDANGNIIFSEEGMPSVDKLLNILEKQSLTASKIKLKR